MKAGYETEQTIEKEETGERRKENGNRATDIKCNPDDPSSDSGSDYVWDYKAWQRREHLDSVDSNLIGIAKNTEDGNDPGAGSCDRCDFV